MFSGGVQLRQHEVEWVGLTLGLIQPIAKERGKVYFNLAPMVQYSVHQIGIGLLNSYFYAFDLNINDFVCVSIVLHRYTDFEPFARYCIKLNRHTSG